MRSTFLSKKESHLHRGIKNPPVKPTIPGGKEMNNKRDQQSNSMEQNNGNGHPLHPSTRLVKAAATISSKNHHLPSGRW